MNAILEVLAVSCMIIAVLLIGVYIYFVARDW
jgi:hypothetical protein